MFQVDLPLELNTELETRRQEALSAAKSLIQVLKQKFGATEAFVCGSLAGDSPWHWHSDLDLGALLLELSEYRKFRHLTRHIYRV